MHQTIYKCEANKSAEVMLPCAQVYVPSLTSYGSLNLQAVTILATRLELICNNRMKLLITSKAIMKAELEASWSLRDVAFVT